MKTNVIMTAKEDESCTAEREEMSSQVGSGPIFCLLL